MKNKNRPKSKPQETDRSNNPVQHHLVTKSRHLDLNALLKARFSAPADTEAAKAK